MSNYGHQYPLYVPPSHLLDIGVKYRIMNHQTMKETEPLTKGIVIFGATGDLCRKKLIPALYKLWEKELLPEHFVITGAARRERTTQQWIESLGMEYPEEFCRMLDYQSCDLEHVESLQKLPNYLDDNTYFLSVPPERYESAITNLKDAGLLEDPDQTRLVIEKPFGHDYKSADRLQSVVERSLREKQVYRIDHYLGKDTVNNILATRFSNILLEPLWNRNYIEEVQIFATETIGCDGRAQYYDTAGAVRDMLQNHMMQLLALIAMEPPCRLSSTEIRREKTKVLAAARLGQKLVLGQYIGYQDEEGVAQHTKTPTFASGDIYIDNWRWQGVPFYFMTGKKMPYQCVEIVIKLKEPPQVLFEGHKFNDRIVIRLQPTPHLDIRMDMKAPGLGEEVETATLTHPYPTENSIDGYERLLFEAINGNQSHFVHAEEIIESWRIVDDLICTGEKCPIRTTPYIYHQGSWGPQHKTEFITNWDYPQ